MDIESSECAAFEGGQSLFLRVRPDFIQVEALRAPVRACMLSQAKAHGYGIGAHRGHDENTLMFKNAAAQGPRKNCTKDERRYCHDGAL